MSILGRAGTYQLHITPTLLLLEGSDTFSEERDHLLEATDLYPS
jgi:hypothetical protein